MKSKTFVTIFTRLKNIDLLKMPGMTSYYLSRLTDNRINCSLVTLNNDDYSYYETYRSDYNLVILGDKKKLKSPFKIIFTYLRNNAKKIDCLNLYHLDLETYFYSLVYKHYNKKGKIFLELDADERISEFFEPASRKGILKSTNNIRPLKRVIFNGLVKRADYIAAEANKIYDYLISKGNNMLNRKLFLNPYGINTEELRKNINPDIKKENIVLTVGRIGDYQKNNEMLLDAIKKLETINGWKFYFVGPIEKGFQKNINDFFANYPEIKNKVLFTGEVNDRNKLCEYMQSSKVFCLTSRYESWGIVLAEAAFYNCYIISTDVGCAKDVLENMVSGMTVADSGDLVNILNSIINGKAQVDKPEKPGKKDYLNMNSWENTVSRLLKEINL